jgi:hypothetical protein
MKTDPRYPYVSQCQNGGCNTRGDLRPPIVDTKDPILKPWAAKHMQETNEEVLSGKMAIPFTSQSRCWPGGVPGQLLFLQPMGTSNNSDFTRFDREKLSLINGRHGSLVDYSRSPSSLSDLADYS